MASTTTSITTPGTAVRGAYQGVPFTGVVAGYRWHTMNDSLLVTVRLDDELSGPTMATKPAGSEFIVTVSHDGSPWIDRLGGGDTRIEVSR